MARLIGRVLGVDFVLTAPLAQVSQAFLKEFLKLCPGTAFK